VRLIGGKNSDAHSRGDGGAGRGGAEGKSGSKIVSGKGKESGGEKRDVANKNSVLTGARKRKSDFGTAARAIRDSDRGGQKRLCKNPGRRGNE